MCVSHGPFLSIIQLPKVSTPRSKHHPIVAVPWDAPCSITATAWLCNATWQNEGSVGKMSSSQKHSLSSHVMVGTEKGEFFVIDMWGSLILMQKLHSGPVLAITPRTAAMAPTPDATEEVCIVFADTIACIPMPELLVFFRLHEAGSGQAYDPSLKIAYGKYKMPRRSGPRTDGMCLGPGQTNLRSLLTLGDGSEEMRKVTLIAGGSSPYLAWYQATLSSGSSGAMALFGKLASRVTFGIPGMAWSVGKQAWKKGVTSFFTSNEDMNDTEVCETMSHLEYSLRDNKRQSSQMLVSPDGCLGVSVDILGRVLLFDTGKLLPIRMWKGYRDAQCAWVKKSLDGSTPQVEALHLAIYAPRRQCVELWAVRYGSRVASFQVSGNGQLMQTNKPMGLEEDDSWDVDCCLLDFGSGELSFIGEMAFGTQEIE